MNRHGGQRGMSWFPGMTRSGGPRERSSASRTLVLLGGVAVSQVAARDDQFGGELGDERPQVVLHLGLLTRARMEVGNLQDA